MAYGDIYGQMLMDNLMRKGRAARTRAKDAAGLQSAGGVQSGALQSNLDSIAGQEAVEGSGINLLATELNRAEKERNDELERIRKEEQKAKKWGAIGTGVNLGANLLNLVAPGAGTAAQAVAGAVMPGASGQRTADSGQGTGPLPATATLPDAERVNQIMGGQRPAGMTLAEWLKRLAMKGQYPQGLETYGYQQ
ncbi:MAG: hypothetical protein RDU76_06245 [Candidatus Edwardsbacteria bacterium]|nr:hypothetical protein [Candidatus Edwardsbacteria bacterium]